MSKGEKNPFDITLYILIASSKEKKRILYGWDP